MDIERIREAAGGSAHNAIISFRLTEADKERLVEVCLEQGLSVGKVMRELVEQFVEVANDIQRS